MAETGIALKQQICTSDSNGHMYNVHIGGRMNVLCAPFSSN